MITILVDTEEEKQNLLKESEYIHNLTLIDSEKAQVLMHIYINPNIIKIK